MNNPTSQSPQTTTDPVAPAMLDIIRDWYNRNFSDPQAVILSMVLLLAFAMLWFFGDILTPVLVALVLAYLFEGIVAIMVRWGAPRTLSVIVVLLLFIAFSLIIFFGLLPVLSQQLTQMVRELPGMIAKGQEQLLRLPEMYPDVFTAEQITDLINEVRAEAGSIGQNILTFSVGSLGTLVMITIYAVLVPFMVFFALKDKDKILAWANKFVPRRSELSFKVWRDVDQKMANYIRGKVIEIVIVWVGTYVMFALMGLNYSLLLSALVGLSVIIPYVGAVVVTVPIVLIGFFQWGFTAHLGWLLLFYQIIQVLDGNVLVPLLFSEAVNIHPLAIIVAVLFFGGLFGVWGVFFAIPLATLIQAVFNAWPRHGHRSADTADVRG
ncbi:MAG: AI-2E family transporter [Granulosicoccaceae bacterium]